MKYKWDYLTFPMGWWPHVGFYLYFGPLNYSRGFGLVMGISLFYIELSLEVLK